MIFTHDLSPERARLMPWRTVCEVAAAAPEHGVDARLLSLGEGSGVLEGGLLPSGTRAVAKTTAEWQRHVAAEVEAFDPAVVFWPLSWREPRARTQALERLARPAIGYFSGGVFATGQVMRAARRIGLRRAAPYLAEALAPKRRQLKRFRAAGIGAVVAMTEYTARVLRDQGWPADHVHVVPPGREAAASRRPQGELPPVAADFVKDDPCFLFMGPPAEIRGVHVLLQAFDEVASNHRHVKLICLFRSDTVGVEEAKFRAALAALRHADRVYACWRSLARPPLESYIERAHAILLPFLLVPSEIPLAVLDAMTRGKPVISNDEGGTGEFVRRFGLTFRSADARGLASAMERLLLEPDLHRAKARAAAELGVSHPSWTEVSSRWLQLAGQVAG